MGTRFRRDDYCRMGRLTTQMKYICMQRRLQADCDEEALDLLLAVANGDAYAATCTNA